MSPLARRLVRAAIAAACLAGLAWLIVRLGPRRVAAAAAGADPLLLALSVLPVLARFLIWAHKWRRMLRREPREQPGFAETVGMLAAGSFANLVTPTAKLAGGVVRAAMLRRRHGWPRATAYGCAMADQVTNVLGNVLVFGVFAVAVGASRPAGPEAALLLTAGGAALVGLALLAALRGRLWALARDPRPAAVLARLLPGRIGGDDREATADRAARVLRPLLGRGSPAGTFLPDVAWAGVAFLAVCVANALVLAALGSDTSLVEASVAVALAYFAGVLVGFGGVGVTEVALTALWIRAGVPPDRAAAAALLHRAVFYAVVVALGAPAWWLRRR